MRMNSVWESTSRSLRHYTVSKMKDGWSIVQKVVASVGKSAVRTFYKMLSMIIKVHDLLSAFNTPGWAS